MIDDSLQWIFKFGMCTRALCYFSSPVRRLTKRVKHFPVVKLREQKIHNFTFHIICRVIKRRGDVWEGHMGEAGCVYKVLHWEHNGKRLFWTVTWPIDGRHNCGLLWWGCWLFCFLDNGISWSADSLRTARRWILSCITNSVLILCVF
jgi:hypothetical protein